MPKQPPLEKNVLSPEEEANLRKLLNETYNQQLQRLFDANLPLGQIKSFTKAQERVVNAVIKHGIKRHKIPFLLIPDRREFILGQQMSMVNTRGIRGLVDRRMHQIIIKDVGDIPTTAYCVLGVSANYNSRGKTGLEATAIINKGSRGYDFKALTISELIAMAMHTTLLNSYSQAFAGSSTCHRLARSMPVIKMVQKIPILSIGLDCDQGDRIVTPHCEKRIKL